MPVTLSISSTSYFQEALGSRWSTILFSAPRVRTEHSDTNATATISFCISSPYCVDIRWLGYHLIQMRTHIVVNHRIFFFCYLRRCRAHSQLCFTILLFSTVTSDLPSADGWTVVPRTISVEVRVLP